MFLRNGHPFDDSRLQTERSDDISLLLVKLYKTLSKLEKVTKFYGGAAALVTHLFDVDQSIDCFALYHLWMGKARPTSLRVHFGMEKNPPEKSQKQHNISDMTWLGCSDLFVACLFLKN